MTKRYPLGATALVQLTDQPHLVPIEQEMLQAHGLGRERAAEAIAAQAQFALDHFEGFDAQFSYLTSFVQELRRLVKEN